MLTPDSKIQDHHRESDKSPLIIPRINYKTKSTNDQRIITGMDKENQENKNTYMK